jgi:glycerophosphoryl diester phosphodiesterase
VLNIAHRGGAALWPENTLYAFRQAAAAGYDGAELDVQLTRDGQLAVFHDFMLKPELCRDVDGSWIRRSDRRLISDLAWSELRAFDVGRIKPRTLYARRHRVAHPRDGEAIPRLSDVIEAVRTINPAFKLFIEIKTSAEDRTLSAPGEAVAEAVVAELRRTGFLEHAELVGFDWAALRRAKSIEPRLRAWFTTKRRGPHTSRAWAARFHPSKFGGSIPKAIAAAGGDGWLGAAVQARASRIAEAHELGLKVAVWTVNDSRSMRAFKRLRVDALVTDRPDRLAELG